MIRQVLALGAISLGLAHDPGGCGEVDSASGGINAPCTRDKDCGSALVCRQGVCDGADAGPIPDGASDGAGRDAPGDG